MSISRRAAYWAVVFSICCCWGCSTPLLRRAETGHILAAGLGCILLALVMLSLYVTQTLSLPAIGWFGVPSLVILGVYIMSVRIISFFERRRAEEMRHQEAEVAQYAAIPLWRAAVTFGLLSLAIVGLGLWLAVVGEEIAQITGLGRSFVGAIFLAITTSLPEIVASYTALRMGAVDLAVSNIFGSNIFNIAALAVYDLVDVRGSLWTTLQPIHGFTAIAAALMTVLAIVALVYQAAKKPRWRLSWDALLLLVLYIGSMYVVYRST